MNQAAAADQYSPSVSADAAGNFVVTRQDGVYMSGTVPNAIEFRRYDAAGNPLSGDSGGVYVQRFEPILPLAVSPERSDLFGGTPILEEGAEILA